MSERCIALFTIFCALACVSACGVTNGFIIDKSSGLELDTSVGG